MVSACCMGSYCWFMQLFVWTSFLVNHVLVLVRTCLFWAGVNVRTEGALLESLVDILLLFLHDFLNFILNKKITYGFFTLKLGFRRQNLSRHDNWKQIFNFFRSRIWLKNLSTYDKAVLTDYNGILLAVKTGILPLSTLENRLNVYR